MTQHIENYCRRTEMLLRLLEGDLSSGVSEACKDEIRRCLHVLEPGPGEAAVVLAEADE